MALTPEQIAIEKQNEAKLNELSDKIIGYTPWGQLYPLMRLAAATGEGAIPHQICVSADGREVKVYKGTAGKLVGAFLKPTHEYVTMYIAQKDYGKAFASVFGVAGQLQSFQDQQNATCIKITPNEILNLVKSVPSYDPNTGRRRATATQSESVPLSDPTTETLNKVFSKKNVVNGLALVSGISIFIIILKLGKVF